ncbi:Ribosomal l1 domain-containing protein [Thalictrum thalictroides]|uniref:Ribosomal l1 domain-containing protein n=1 Tax=Thalictrum thalictroides TaxID=46969 RepID=A0A7J6UX00_THATH|nr:Ribosomal l1 domain-containing protein [Thalictrum thalictroides]
MALQNPPQPSTIISTETTGRAVDALLKWVKSKSKQQKSQLFEQDDYVYLTLTVKKIPPKGRVNPYKILLPNSLHPFDSSEEFCLIIDDRSKSSLTSEAAKKKIEAENIPISKVLKLSKLKSDYRPFEAKRKLRCSYDMFFADKRIIPLLPRHLGKEFFKKKKIPVPVDLSHKNWKEQIQQVCSSALLYLSTGTCSVIKVGRISQGRDEIVANVAAAIDGITEIVPKKWANIRSFHLKLSESVALPIYQSVPEIGLKIEGIKKHEEEKKVDSKAESGEESLGEGKKKKLGNKKKAKKGRIHEVRYMDNNLGDMFDDISSEDDVSYDNDVLGTDLGKKRKKVDTVEVRVEKKVKKGEIIKKKKQEKAVDDIPVSNGEKKSAKLKKRDGAKLKKGGEEEVDGDEVVGDMPVSGDAKKKKSKIVTSVNKLASPSEIVCLRNGRE